MISPSRIRIFNLCGRLFLEKHRPEPEPRTSKGAELHAAVEALMKGKKA